MEARILPLSNPSAATLRSVAGPASVRIDGERIVVERLVLVDGALAAALAERDEAERPAVVERALRIGLLALQDAATSMDTDVVRREFEKLVAQTTAANEQAARAVEDVLRSNFADGDGRLPRTLERFLGDRGRTPEVRHRAVRRDEAGLRHRAHPRPPGHLLRRRRLATGGAPGPTRLGSPLHQFRQEINEGFKGVHERLTAIEAASRARADERSRSAAKGGDFEDLLEGMLGELARGAGDLLDRTGTESGALVGSKKGDFVLTLDPRLTRGADVRIVIEAKDRVMSPRAMREELREARENRGASVAVAAWSAKHAPAGVAPFTVSGEDVHVVVDPDAPDPAYLEAAVRLARLLALVKLGERDVEVDAPAIARALTGVKEQLEAIRALKTQLTSVANVTKSVADGLDAMRAGILARVAEAEAELASRPRIAA